MATTMSQFAAQFEKQLPAHQAKVRADKTGARAEAFREIEAMPTTAKKKMPSKPRAKGRLLSLAIFLPIRIHSEANERDHWSTKASRVAKQREEIEIEWYRLTKNAPVALPCNVLLTRLGAKPLDNDNLIGGMKATRDAIAKILGVDDADPRVTFLYDQEATGRREYGVRIEVVSL